MSTVTHRAITSRLRNRAITSRINTTSVMITAWRNHTLVGMAVVIATTPATTITSSAHNVTMHNGVASAVVMTGAMSVKVGSASATDCHI
jgi:hypothetical protein